MEDVSKQTKRRSPASRQIVVDVTEEIIKTSVAADSAHCMIAEAVKKALPGCTHVSVDLQTIRLNDPTRPRRYVYLTPRIAQVPLLQFDHGMLPEPFKFVLRGAHVINRHGKGTAKGVKKTGSKSTAKGVAKAAEAKQALVKARLVPRDPSNPYQVDRVGGKAPPKLPFGNRRAFGLRALGRPSSPAKAEDKNERAEK